VRCAGCAVKVVGSDSRGGGLRWCSGSLTFVPNLKLDHVSNKSPDKGSGGGPIFFFEAGSRKKLTRAFPAIDSLFAGFRVQCKVPGATLGIVVDSELAHAGATGVRELGTDAPALPDTIFASPR
jgi:hypothetical protein